MKIKKYPDPVLREKCIPVGKNDFDTDVLRKTAHKLLETAQLYKAYGIAAPQLGIPQRIIVRNTFLEGVEGYEVLCNPKIIWSSEEEKSEFEACLSIPWVRAKVKRPVSITFTANLLDGSEIELTEHGINARILQHEIDHLDGILFTDRLTMFQRGCVRNKLKRLKRRAKKDKKRGEEEKNRAGQIAKSVERQGKAWWLR